MYPNVKKAIERNQLTVDINQFTFYVSKCEKYYQITKKQHCVAKKNTMRLGNVDVVTRDAKQLKCSGHHCHSLCIQM